MGKKYAIPVLAASIIWSSLPMSLAMAQTNVVQKGGVVGNYDNIPQKDGTYDVPGRPDLKVRVSVHYPKTQSDLTTQSADPSLASPSTSALSVCKQTDPDSQAVDAIGNWHLPTGNWTYRLNTSSAPASIGKTNFANLASIAFGKWSSAVNGKVKFVRGADTTVSQPNADDGINLIAWGTVPNGALAVTYSAMYSNGTVANSDTIISKNFSWSWTLYSSTACTNAKAYDVQDVLSHEFGHWMGLTDDYASTYANNTMYGSVSMGEIKKDTLATGDISGVKKIYK